MDAHIGTRRLIAFVLAVFAVIAPTTAQPKQTPAQVRETSRLIAEYRRAKRSPERRSAAVTKIIALGEPAVIKLLEVIGKELSSPFSRYEIGFRKQASLLAKTRLAKVNPLQIQQLRAKVLALKERANLTKEMIVREADPIMKQLRELLVLDRKVVIENASRKLLAERKQLIAGGQGWEKCTQFLAKNAKQPGDQPATAPSFEEYLESREKLAAQLAVPMDAKTRAVLATNARLARRLDEEEARAILACNLTRNLLGLNPCAIDLKLVSASRAHSTDMQRLKFFSHTSPVPGRKTPQDRAALFGARASGENIFMGRTDGLYANKAWFHSPGHHKNMLSNHNRIGVGRTGRYFTQMFGR